MTGREETSYARGRVLRKDRLHVVAKELQLSWCIQQVAIWPLQLGFDLWGPRPISFLSVLCAM